MIYMINQEKQRFYWISIQEDLFGQWCVVKVYGSLNNQRGREIWEVCESQLIASQRMFDIECLRRKRGYVYADTSNAENYALTPELIGLI